MGKGPFDQFGQWDPVKRILSGNSPNSGLSGIKPKSLSPLGPPPFPTSPPNIPLIPPPPASEPTAPPLAPGLAHCRMLVEHYLRKKATLTSGRVLPGIDDLAVMEGRKIKGAFVYSDLHGFTKLVATQLTDKSFIFLQAFIAIASRITKHYNGEVMDVAGDRVLSVFHRSPGDLSSEPVYDAVGYALWLQTVFNKVIGPAFSGGGLGSLSLGIGIDYGDAVVGCVGIRNNKRIVFFGNPANYAAHLQELAGQSETILSAAADGRRPAFLGHESWSLRREKLATGESILRINQWFNAVNPPKVR